MVSDVSSYSDTPASVPSTLASKRESVGLSTTVTLMSPTVPEGEPLAGRNRVAHVPGLTSMTDVIASRSSACRVVWTTRTLHSAWVTTSPGTDPSI